MELDWSTFALEIINFLALLWILKRFLYRPILAVVAERQARIESALNDARQTELRTEGLKTQFEGRLADWEQEKAGARARFEAELAAERGRQMEALSRDLATERERNAAQEANREETLRRELNAGAATAARQFASALLARLAGADLEIRLVDLFLEEFADLPEDRLAPVRNGRNAGGKIVVTSAYPLPEAQRQRISSAIEARLGQHGSIDFVQDKALLAGVRLTLGALQIELSLAGELEFFAEDSRRAR